MDHTNLIALLLESTTLKWMPRTGWQMRGVPQVESVADHSFGTAFLALALVDALRQSQLQETVDLEKVLIMALLHDLGEARLTDLPATATRLLPPEVKSQAESSAVAALLEPLPSAGRWGDLWHEFEGASSAEGRLVRDADKLEMMVQCLRYELAGSTGLDEFWRVMDQFHWHYPLCEQVYHRLREMRRRGG